jgi:hydrogenase expression/formation protein HypE
MLKQGKLPPDFLEYLIKNYTHKNNRIVVGPGIGKDAAVIDTGKKYLVAKTDPVTLANKEAGWYLVNINANDLACMGAKPEWFIATLLLPEKGTTTKSIEEIFAAISGACRKLGITLCGGHCEITHGISKPIIVGAMFAELEKKKLVRGNVKPGDSIILTKGIAIEGTAIMANEKEKILKKKFPRSFIGKARMYLHNPGISIVKDALTANSAADIHYMHDPTEGGLATGLCEVAKACNVGLIVDEDKIPVLPESKILCEKFGLDIMGTIASGALIIICGRKNTEKVIAALRKNKIAASAIGEITGRKTGARIKDAGGNMQNLKYFPQDEIIKIY